MNLRDHLLTAIFASIKAGDATLEIYGQEFSVQEKSDKSPITIADQRSNEIITSLLAPSDIPVLSEEGKEIDFIVRNNWKYLWIVDPLDGTKEFIKKNDEFTINIALIKEGLPILGVVYVPALSQLYFAAEKIGAYRLHIDELVRFGCKSLDDFINAAQTIKIDKSETRPFTIVGSRSHSTPEVEAYVNEKRKKHTNVDFIASGSSLKFCRVAEGSADVYPRLGTTMEWDTAAGQAIAEQAGAVVIDFNTGKRLTYNKNDLKNPWFIVSNGKH